MTVTYTFDVFSTLDGFGSYNSSGDWGGYWSKQGPEFLDHRLALERGCRIDPLHRLNRSGERVDVAVSATCGAWGSLIVLIAHRSTPQPAAFVASVSSSASSASTMASARVMCAGACRAK